jgi:hypothetical protein
MILDSTFAEEERRRNFFRLHTNLLKQHFGWKIESGACNLLLCFFISVKDSLSFSVEQYTSHEFTFPYTFFRFGFYAHLVS